MSGNLREKLDKIWSDEQRKAFRDAMAEELEKRLEIMRKRQAYFSAVAEEYESFDEFIRTQKDWLDKEDESLPALDRYRVRFSIPLRNPIA